MSAANSAGSESQPVQERPQCGGPSQQLQQQCQRMQQAMASAATPFQVAGQQQPQASTSSQETQLRASTYPPPQATHLQVLQDRELFQSTLESLLNLLGIKLKVPKVGGIEVDLHLLYRQVTLLGGLEPVIQRKQWVVVCEPFNFPSSFTNKSFVIRKLYVTLLHHYEQVYFHRRTGPLVPPPKGLAEAQAQEREKKQKVQAQQAPRTGNGSDIHDTHSGSHQSDGSAAASPTDYADVQSLMPLGTKFNGTIDSYFDRGFMVTVNLPGGQQMQGVLYHAPNLNRADSKRLYHHSHHHHHDSSAYHHHHHDLLPSCYATAEHTSSAKKPKLSMRSSGGATAATAHHLLPATASYFPHHHHHHLATASRPKQARSAFAFFAAMTGAEVRSQYPNADIKQLGKIMNDQWQAMTNEQREPYQEHAKQDKERYDHELEEYYKSPPLTLAMNSSAPEDAADCIADLPSVGAPGALPSSLTDLLPHHAHAEASTADQHHPDSDLLMSHPSAHAHAYDGLHPLSYHYPPYAGRYSGAYGSHHHDPAGFLTPAGHKGYAYPHESHDLHDYHPHEYDHMVYQVGEDPEHHHLSLSYQKSMAAFHGPLGTDLHSMADTAAYHDPHLSHHHHPGLDMSEAPASDGAESPSEVVQFPHAAYHHPGSPAYPSSYYHPGPRGAYAGQYDAYAATAGQQYDALP